MVTEGERLNEHEKFRELGALTNTGTLSPNEWAELKGHLQICEECREVYDQYLFLAKEGIPLLAAGYSHHPEQGKWDGAATRKKLFSRVRATEEQASFEPAGQLKFVDLNRLGRVAVNAQARAAIVACLIVAVGLGAYRLGGRANGGVKQLRVPVDNRFQKLAAEKESVDELLDARRKKIAQLEHQSSRKERELVDLRSALTALEDRASEITTAKTMTSEQLRTTSHERDALSGQLRDAEQAYQNVQPELTSLRSERDKALSRTASLESRIEKLSAITRNQERRIADDEQYLASDRDVRDLMGARKLYIADVFDVDSRSRTKKPFGRVFYTQGKSLIFYAFDLDRYPGLKNARTFQAWGRREADRGKALNLGILYIDNESNRRWALRSDDPEKLAELEAVFVTAEPYGGSREPTGKPFLFALLRKEANHR